MAAVRSIDDLLPTVALAVALATLEDTQRRDGLEDEMEENAPRVKLTPHAARGRSETSACTCGWAQLLENEDLSHSTSITANQFRIDFRLHHVPFSLRATINIANLLRITPLLHQTPPEKTPKTVYSIRRTTRRVATHKQVGKITDRKAACSILVSDCTRNGIQSKLLL